MEVGSIANYALYRIPRVLLLVHLFLESMQNRPSNTEVPIRHLCAKDVRRVLLNMLLNCIMLPDLYTL